jgi:hypothetical protein
LYPPEIKKFFSSKYINITDMEMNYLLDEYDTKQRMYIDVNELEKDY